MTRHYNTALNFAQWQIIMLYPYFPNDDLAELTGYKVNGIRNFASKHSLKKEKGEFEQWEIDYILENYIGDRANVEGIAAHIERTYWAVINKYRELKGLR